ncbi:MAG: DNA mismatch repair endonuclease MutL [Candidatus Cryptobacteroides sp.]
MELRILPGNIADMIAAGEVVQRPSSVVKELVENAVDAGADQICVVIADSGRTLIQVTDNGCGMNPDEAVLCFERHATSKIATAEDLEGIMTFGFRGEALASIAAVAEVTLKTRKEGEETGCEVHFAASRHISTEEAAVPKGTNIAVRNLFYNIPARRKFLKSDTVEFKHIVEEFTRVAITRPGIAFTLIHNGKEVFVLKKAKSVKFRILDLLGHNVTGDIVDVSAETSLVNLMGFVGKPDSARKTLGNQFFFVNGRFFRSPYLHKAVMKAYEDLAPQGTTPSYFIFLETDPRSVDVNISPTKSEVKFEDDSFVFQVIYAAVKETLGKNSFAASIDFSNPEAKDMPVMGRHFTEYENTPSVAFDPQYNPFETSSEGIPSFDFGDGGQKPAAGGGRGSGAWQGGARDFVNSREDYGRLFQENALPVSQTIILDGKYIVTPAKEGLMVVNIRRARERVIFDRTISALSKNEHVTQTTLFPVKVEVGVEARALFDENAGMLSALGFDFSPLGEDTIVVGGVPEGFSGEPGKVHTMVGDLTLILADESSLLPSLMQTALAEKIAMLGASNCETIASPAEARHLVDLLLSSSNPELTSNGRRIMSIIPTATIEKQF